MASNVIPHPANKLHQMIEAAQPMNADGFTRILIYALENNLSRDSREPLEQLLASITGGKGFQGAARCFVDWCSHVEFSPSHTSSDAPERSEKTTAEDGDLPQAEGRARFFAKIAELGRAVDETAAYASTHKYWLFRPGWEIESALWNELFGENDPATVIAFYLREIFDPEPAPERPTTRVALLRTDRLIIGSLIDSFAKALAGGKDGAHHALLRRAIITACRLEGLSEGGLVWTDSDFSTAICSVPEWLALPLVEYWARRADFSEVAGADEATQANARAQARLIGSGIIKSLDPDADLELASVPTLKGLSDGVICDTVGVIKSLEIELQDSGLNTVLESLNETIYLSRMSLYGGIFPFSIDRAPDIIGQLSSREEFWLASIAYYNAIDYEYESDCYRVFSSEDDVRASGSKRINPRALRRFSSFKSALRSIQRERLDELARAWWAFFIASQALGFGGLRLPPPQIAEVVDTASGLLPDEAIQRALHFAVAMAGEHGSALESRITASLVSRLPEPGGTKINNVVEMTLPRDHAERFLEKAIGSSDWRRLGQQSRLDLIEAEQLWARSAMEYGAGRSDWGSLITLYARAIEAETRSHVRPLVEALDQLGVCKISELTLGGCISAIREAAKALRKSPDLPLSQGAKLAIGRLKTFFADQNTFLEYYRNRASHGNREEPISEVEFLNWRQAMFVGGLFNVVLSVSSKE